MKTSEQIGYEVIEANHGTGAHWVGYIDTHEICDLIKQAIRIDRTQRADTLVDEARDVEVGVWPADPDMTADDGPKAIVVQIDTGAASGRVRVNLNEAPIWDGDPETDGAPGAYFDLNPERRART